jgi:hypothetical protein
LVPQYRTPPHLPHPPEGICSFGFILKNRGFIIFQLTMKLSGEAVSSRYTCTATVGSAEGPGVFSRAFGAHLPWRAAPGVQVSPTSTIRIVEAHQPHDHSSRRIIVCNFFLKSTRFTRIPFQKRSHQPSFPLPSSPFFLSVSIRVHRCSPRPISPTFDHSPFSILHDPPPLSSFLCV